VTDLSHEQERALKIAAGLALAGAPIFSAYRNSSEPGEFLYPSGWQDIRGGEQSLNWINRWRPGMALCMVTGVLLDVLDVDPRNGGLDGYRELVDADAWPPSIGQTRTPSAGNHHLIPRTHLAKGKPAQGIDLQAGADDGSGRGFVFLPPTVRPSKYGEHLGQDRAYEWEIEPDVSSDVMELAAAAPAHRQLIIVSTRARAPKRVVRPPTDDRDDSDAFYDDAEAGIWSAAEADRIITGQLAAVAAAREGEINSALGGAARVLGRFVAGGWLAEDRAAEMLLDALEAGGVHSDRWNREHGKSWTAATCIGAGLARGAEEPWTVVSESAPAPVAGAPVVDAAPERVVPSVAFPRLMITSAAEMTYWLQSVLGSGSLSGFFLRNGAVVHTPLVNEIGYVEPRDDADDNGPAQIQAVSAGQLTAKIQYAHACYKSVDVKDEAGKKTGEKTDVPALFPLEASKRAVDAPEAMGMLRTLRGITHTPMVRADGTVLAAPGYDRASGYLFLPGPGVKVPPVPEAPTPAEVEAAVALLDEMTAGFPWVGPDDKINYYGALLTPLLRLVCPPTYKMFGIGAHQPGSGKTLLADVLTILHGGVLRSEMPEDEAEMRKQATSILAGTSAPVVHIDNVTGVLRSSTLAGLLTAGQATSDRELGSTRMLTTVNDRMWVVTGNNLSLGGDLVRRTIIITIDPDMANPETRSFAIKDLKAWTNTNRNRVLHALLTIIRAWVAAGRPLQDRAQSDSFATWEATVGGILAVAGVPGSFDAESGKKAAVGGDDDGLAVLLETLHERFGSGTWTVADALSATVSGDVGDFVTENRDWLPSSVLDKLARSEPSGRKSFGRWLLNRLGRWVSTEEGAALVLREAGKDPYKVRLWKIEQR